MRLKKFIENFDPKNLEKVTWIRKNPAFFAKYTCDDINAPLHSSKFYNELKEEDIVLEHKKKSKLSKENYRPTSILPNISKF